jgi:hypothetical protein
MNLRAIDPEPFVSLAGEMPDLDCGEAPKLQWIEIARLAIDPSYQRELGPAGKKNIVRIAREFEWSRFATVVVAPIGKDRFAIVDGQHRTTAAALRGLKKVPCQIIDVDRKRQAASFAAINSNITLMSTMQLHAAKLASGDPAAVNLHGVCASAGVTICRYPIPANKMKVGETLAASQLANFLARYGETVLRRALCCITKTGDGHVGLVKGALIAALCAVLEKRDMPDAALFAAIGTLDLRAMFDKAGQDARMSRSKITTFLIDLIAAHLDGRTSPAKPARAVVPAKPARPMAAPAEVVRPVSSQPPRQPAIASVSYSGVTVDVEAGLIQFQGKPAKLRHRVAMLAALLARAIPNPIGLDFLRRRVWAGTRMPDDADYALSSLAMELADVVKALGLGIKVVKGAGIAMGVAE